MFQLRVKLHLSFSSSEVNNQTSLFQAGGDREVVGGVVNLWVLQESPSDHRALSSALGALLLVSFHACLAETPCWGDWCMCQDQNGEKGLEVEGMCS